MTLVESRNSVTSGSGSSPGIVTPASGESAAETDSSSTAASVGGDLRSEMSVHPTLVVRSAVAEVVVFVRSVLSTGDCGVCVMMIGFTRESSMLYSPGSRPCCATGLVNPLLSRRDPADRPAVGFEADNVVVGWGCSSLRVVQNVSEDRSDQLSVSIGRFFFEAESAFRPPSVSAV